MALSNVNKDVITRLMKMISSDDQLSEVKSDHAAYAKLNLLASQMHMLQEQARHILEESRTNSRLHKVEMHAAKVPGTVYYLYTQNGKDVLSIISPQEWDTYDSFHGAFVYDYDHTFRKVVRP